MQSGAEGVRMTTMDVGKGDCILVQAGASSVLIDTGYENTSSKVVSYLRGQGVSRIDYLVITHYDRDHVGGLRAIGEAFDIGAVLLPGYQGADKNYRKAMAAIDDLRLPAQQVTEERVLEVGGARFCIMPSTVAFVPDAKGDEGNDDDLSLVSTLTYGDDSYLFAGDLEYAGVAAYLKRGLGRFDVLKVPDHGHKHDNTGDFIKSVQPKLAIVTDGADEPANKKILKLLESGGAEVYRTGSRGTIVVESAGAGSYTVSVEK